MNTARTTWNTEYNRDKTFDREFVLYKSVCYDHGFHSIGIISSYLVAIIVTALFILTTFRYLDLQSQLQQHRRTIHSLESELTNISTKNEDTIRRIRNTEDISAIRDIAINTLGMAEATPDQIITFQTEDYDYVCQIR